MHWRMALLWAAIPAVHHETPPWGEKQAISKAGGDAGRGLSQE